MKDYLLVGIPLIFALITSFFSFQYGKRSKKYAIILSKAIPLAERILELLNQINELNNQLTSYFKNNFGKDTPFEDKIDKFRAYSYTLDKDAKENIQELLKKRDDLKELITKSYLYLNNEILHSIKKYLSIGDFVFSKGIQFSDFEEKFWANLTNAENITKRDFYYSKIIKKLNKLLPK